MMLFVSFLSVHSVSVRPSLLQSSMRQLQQLQQLKSLCSRLNAHCLVSMAFLAEINCRLGLNVMSGAVHCRC